MTPQERDLIESVFSRLNQMTNTPKDPEAAALIAERLRGLPDAAYGLVLAVVMQDVSIKQAQARITELERRVAEGSPAPSAGGFLGAAAVANPWAQSPPRAASPIPQVAPPMQQQYAPPPQSAPQAPSPWGGQGGGFLHNAATTAAGVAGGMLLAEGVSSLFSGHHGGGFGGGYGGFGGPNGQGMTENVVVNNYYGDASPNDYGSSASADANDVDNSDDGNSDLGFDNSSDGGDSWL